MPHDLGHHAGVVPGGFKSVELNAVGWIVALGPAALIGAVVGLAVADGVTALIIGAAFGAASGFAGARLWDEVRDRRRLTNVAVADHVEAVKLLGEAGIKSVGASHEDSDGSVTAYVTVHERKRPDVLHLVGLPRGGTRADRRARQAERGVLQLPKLRPR